MDLEINLWRSYITISYQVESIKPWLQLDYHQIPKHGSVVIFGWILGGLSLRFCVFDALVIASFAQELSFIVLVGPHAGGAIVGQVCQMANLASTWLSENGTGSLKGKDQQQLRQNLLKDRVL